MELNIIRIIKTTISSAVIVTVSAILIAIGCNPKDTSKDKPSPCLDSINMFVKAIDNNDANQFIGLTISPRGLERDDTGKRYIRSILFTDKKKNRFSVSTGQVINGNSPVTSSAENKIRFAENYGIAVEDLDFFVNKIVQEFDELNVASITSQLSSGEFVEFELTNSCSVWYKQDSAYLNDTYKVLFDEAQKIKDNWYVIKSRRIAPVLKEHPPIIKIN